MERDLIPGSSKWNLMTTKERVDYLIHRSFSHEHIGILGRKWIVVQYTTEMDSNGDIIYRFDIVGKYPDVSTIESYFTYRSKLP